MSPCVAASRSPLWASCPSPYTGTIDLNRALATLPPAVRSQGEPTVNLAQEPAAVAYRATVDEQGRLTHLTFSYPERSSDATIETDIDLGGFGAPVAIERPSPERISDAVDKDHASL